MSQVVEKLRVVPLFCLLQHDYYLVICSLMATVKSLYNNVLLIHCNLAILNIVDIVKI